MIMAPVAIVEVSFESDARLISIAENNSFNVSDLVEDRSGIALPVN